MRNKKRFFCVLLLMITILSSGKVFANTAFTSVLGEFEYTEEFKEWLELSAEEKKQSIIPRSYEISEVTWEYTNPIKIAHTVGTATLTKYDLRDYIPENLVIKNQLQTNTCWAFASIGMLESHLGIQDYMNNKSVVQYDFSERHMQYSTLREFNDGKINIWGGNRELNTGGNVFRSRPYLTNGLGPIKESDMPFENNENKINIEEIQGKKVVAQVYDTIDFPTSEQGKDNSELIKQMKDHIRKNGGIEAGINGSNLDTEFFNIDTGAINVNDKTRGPIDHDVIIIGWDDNYSIENFNELCRPKNNGAWIIKNSWGTETTIKFSELKEAIFESYKENCIQNGWNSPEEIPDEFIRNTYKDSNYEVRDDEIALEIGDKGFMYVSYEDVNIYNDLFGIENATSTVNYDKVYQYDELGAPLGLPLNIKKVYVANVFERTKTDLECLTEVSALFAQATNCKVYVNPNSDSKDSKDLVQIELKDGNYENVNPGYHTFEFKEPLQLNGDKFVVMLELEGISDDGYTILMESIVKDTPWSTVKLEKDKSFWTISGEYEKNVWASFSQTEELSGGTIPNGDSSIKAFTVKNVKQPQLTNIEISVPPNKVEYIEGQDFDKTGMVVKAVYDDRTKEEITSYTIENGTDLKVEQKTVIIKYEDKITTQNITVVPKPSTNPDPDQNPNPNQNQNPDDEDDKKEEEKPESTDFSKAKAAASKIKAYYFTNKDNKEYIKMDVLISDITRKENDEYNYYYYLSASKNEKNIKNWVKIETKQESKTKLEFNVDTNDITNYTEISKSDNIYIYIKEVVKKNDNKKEIVTSAISLTKTGDVEIYKDNKLQQASNNNNNNNNSNNTNTNTNNNTNTNKNNNSSNNNKTNTQKDQTTSNSKLPAAGLKMSILFIIISIAIWGSIKFIQYNKMNF